MKSVDSRRTFLIGGIGVGMFRIVGADGISNLSVKYSPEIFNAPFTFAAMSIKGVENGTKVLEAPVTTGKLFGSIWVGNFTGGVNYGLPRIVCSLFLSRFPFASLELEDKEMIRNKKGTFYFIAAHTRKNPQRAMY